jgi:hypothetical protein
VNKSKTICRVRLKLKADSREVRIPEVKGKEINTSRWEIREKFTM